ncbi:MAG: hypothetical protein VKJ64_00480 [Leptolyngbyaceae bacterium]|nr:hypothetical protein [Leptolyngbyaceae bacterium]
MVIAGSSHLSHPFSEYHRPEYHQFLIIGHGNEDYGDDGVGPYVTKLILNWKLPWVSTIVTPTLSLDLVAHIIESRYVIFVDAGRHRCVQAIQVEPIEPWQIPSSTDSEGDRLFTPATLLGLARTLYPCQTQVWAIHVAATSFVPHSQMSAVAYHGCDRALSTIARFFMTYGQGSRISPSFPHSLQPTGSARNIPEPEI